MRTKTNHFLLELIDIVKQELLAILAVAGILAFVFNQATASHPGVANAENQIATAATIEEPTPNSSDSTGAALFGGNPTLYFGRQIKGINNTNEAWTNTELVANLGNSIIVAAPVQVTITGMNNGTFTIYATASGTLTANGIKFVMGDKQSINRGVVIIEQNKLLIKFEAEAKIWTLSTIAGNVDIATDRTPTIMSVLPETKNLRIGSVLTPVVIIQDLDGKIMPAPIIIWSSSNETVATVDDNGKIKALKTGVATISATIAGTDITASISINIPTLAVEAPPRIKINVAPESTVDQLVSEIAKENAGGNSAATPKPVIGITQSLVEFFSSQKTSAANLGTILGMGQSSINETNSVTIRPNSNQNQTIIAKPEVSPANLANLTVKTKMPILQRIGHFFKKVFSLSTIKLYLKR